MFLVLITSLKSISLVEVNQAIFAWSFAAVEERAQPDLGVLLLVVDVPGLGAAVTNVNDQDKLHEVGDVEASEKDDLSEG